ncbi:glycosyltransferase [Bacteroidota bacterium]
MFTKKILVAPLDWGLGHASRMIPVITMLLSHGADVIIAADGHGFELLKKEFPGLKFIRLSFPKIKYSRRQYLISKFIFFSPIILFGIIREHFVLKKIIKQENIDIIISDNRYGLWHKKIKSIFISHQLMIKLPLWLKFAEYILHLILLKLINRFDICWIPDFEHKGGLSGDLSHKFSIPAKSLFIGPLSRFKNIKAYTSPVIRDVLIILSGPEPQRTVLEEILIIQLKNTKLNTLIVRGLPGCKEINSPAENIKFLSYLSSEKLLSEIHKSEIIICRAGYSSIMDLFTINKKAIIIPTPGQTEQIYLGKFLNDKKMFYSVSQKDFKLNEAINKLADYYPAKKFKPDNTLENEIEKLFSA